MIASVYKVQATEFSINSIIFKGIVVIGVNFWKKICKYNYGMKHKTFFDGSEK